MQNVKNSNFTFSILLQRSLVSMPEMDPIRPDMGYFISVTYPSKADNVCVCVFFLSIWTTEK